MANLILRTKDKLASFFKGGGNLGYSQTFSLVNLPVPRRRNLQPDIGVPDALAHELVFRCLQKITDAASDVAPTVEERKRSGEWQVAPNHPLTRQFQRPNDEMSWPEFFSALITDEHVFGRWYVEVLRARRSSGVLGFRVLDVRSVIETGESGQTDSINNWLDYNFNKESIGEIRAYQVNDGSHVRDIDPENMIAVYLFDARSPLAGLSPVRVALAAVSLDLKLTAYADTYLEKGGPPGLLRIKNKKLDKTQAEVIQERWYESYRLGGRREGRVAVLDEDAEYQPIGSHLGDVAGDEFKQHQQSAICAALGVPPSLAGAYVGLRWGNQRAGMVQAQKDFWVNKISPLLSRYRHIFDGTFLALYEDDALVGTRVRCNWDVSQVPALGEDVDLIANRVRSNYGAGLVTLNEARQAMKYPGIENGDLLKGQAAKPNGGQPGKEKPPSALQRKAYLWNGYELSRKPRVEEEKSVPLIAGAQRAAYEFALSIALDAQKELIDLSIENLTEAKKDYNTVSAEVSPKTKTRIERGAKTGANLGAMSVADQIEEKAAKADRRANIDAIAKRIAESIAEAIANAVTARVVSYFLRRLVKGIEKENALRAAEAEARGESVSYIEDLARGLAYQAVAEGRRAETIERAAQIARYEYSALLDANLCDPCRDDDGKTANDIDDLPQVPNEDCEGRWRCRCSIIFIVK